MTDVEDLLTRTLRDPDRALPPPADLLPSIRARARAQRRTTVLAVAVVALLAAAALLVPAALTRTPPAPVATDPPGGQLDWAARGPLAGDTALVAEAVRFWRSLPRSRPTGDPRVLWAGQVAGTRVVVLQATGPLVAEVADRDGRLELLSLAPVGDPSVAALRLAAGPGTTLLVRPGGTSLALLSGPAATPAPAPLPVPADGVLSLGDDLTGTPLAVLDRDGRILSDGTVGGGTAVARGPVRLAAPFWPVQAGIRPPKASDYADGRRLAASLGATDPVEVSVLDDSTTLDLPGGGTAQPRLYEVSQGGARYVGSAVWVGGTAYCVHLDPATAVPDVFVLRCRLPQTVRGVLLLQPVEGVELTDFRLAAARPGEKAYAVTWNPPLAAGTGSVGLLPPGFPTGAGEVRVVDDSGQARPPIVLPPYRP